MANRMVDSARSILNSYLPDVYIYTDVARGGGKDRYMCSMLQNDCCVVWQVNTMVG